MSLEEGGRIINAREGDVVDGRFLIQKINRESVDISLPGPPARDHPTHSDPAARDAGDRRTSHDDDTKRPSLPPPSRADRALRSLSFLALAASGCATLARLPRSAEREEAREHWDLAVLAYEKAVALDPNDHGAAGRPCSGRA